MARLLLASRGIPDLAGLLRHPGPGPSPALSRGREAVLIPDAAEPLEDPGIPDEVERELERAGLTVTRLALAGATRRTTREVVGAAGVVAVSGGDPFHLLAVARCAGFGDAARAALESGAVYVGYSAGAMVAGPTLEPLSLTSPFIPPPGLDLTGLGLIDLLILPHDDHPGRHDRHLAAQATFGDRVRLIPLRDGDVLVHDDGRESVRRHR
jgi:dipeptidase E